MAQYVDCYCLINSRESSIGMKFLEKFLPMRKESSFDYPVPLYVDSPQYIFRDVKELMEYLQNELNEEYSIYWENTDKENVFKHGMLFFTNDGKMIVGFSIVGNCPDSESVVKYFIEIKTFLKSEIGYITIEEEPPLNSLEFKKLCKKRYVPNSVMGGNHNSSH